MKSEIIDNTKTSIYNPKIGDLISYEVNGNKIIILITSLLGSLDTCFSGTVINVITKDEYGNFFKIGYYSTRLGKKYINKFTGEIKLTQD